MKLVTVILCLVASAARAQAGEPTAAQTAATATARVGLELVLGAGAQYVLFSTALVVGCRLGTCLFGAALGLAAGAPPGVAAADLLFEPSPHLGAAYAGELVGALLAIVIFSVHPWSDYQLDDFYMVLLGTLTPTLFAVIGSELFPRMSNAYGQPVLSLTSSGTPTVGWAARF
jgi:hypothetical protein